MGKYYIDCEFDGHNGPLLSMAIVRDARNSLMIVTGESADDPWVAENVIPILNSDRAQETVFTSIDGVGAHLSDFIADDAHPVIIADSPVDIARFCRAMSTGVNGQWATADYTRMTFEVHNVDCYPTDLPGAVQHNAWWDAMALRHKLANLTQNRRKGEGQMVEVTLECLGTEEGDPRGVYAYGHIDTTAITLAAINKALDDQGFDEIDRATIEHLWMVCDDMDDEETASDYPWNWCEAGTPDAIAVTGVKFP